MPIAANIPAEISLAVDALQSPRLGGWNLLAFSLGLLLLIILAARLKSRFISLRLRRLASQHRLRYSPIDRFHLAPRVAEWLAIGAADVRVRDLMYRVGAVEYVYVFTAEYAIGAIGGIKRRRVVGRASEPVGRSVPTLNRVFLADVRRPIRVQYQSMIEDLALDA